MAANILNSPRAVQMSVFVVRAFLKMRGLLGGTRAVVTGTPEGILLKPATAALIKRGRGIIRRKPGEPPMSEWWAEHKKQEKELEERHAR